MTLKIRLPKAFPTVKIERASNNYLILNETHFMIVKPTNAQFDFNLQGYSNDMVFKTNNTERMRLKADGTINFSNLPGVIAGLTSGDLWVDSGGFLKVIP